MGQQQGAPKPKGYKAGFEKYANRCNNWALPQEHPL